MIITMYIIARADTAYNRRNCAPSSLNIIHHIHTVYVGKLLVEFFYDYNYVHYCSRRYCI